MLVFYVQLLDDPELKQQFEELYYKYRSFMFAAANNILKDEGLAEDAVHETFLRVARQLSRVCRLRQEKLESYLFIATKNTCLNMARKREHEVNVPQVYPSQGEPPRDEVLEKIIEKATKIEINNAICQLPDSIRDVLYLYEVNEMRQKDIAEIMQISENAVSKRIQRGRSMLKETLQDIYSREMEEANEQ